MATLCGCLESDYSQLATPPCPEQVPRRDWLKLYVPSPHCAVAPAGADELEWGLQTVLPALLTYVPFGQSTAVEVCAGATYVPIAFTSFTGAVVTVSTGSVRLVSTPSV